MKRTILFFFACALLLPIACRAADHEFDSVVQGIETHYSTHAQKVPLMAFASFCARIATHNGVKDMRIAEFQNLERVDAVELSSFLQSSLGSLWQPVVVSREMKNGEGEQSVIFASPNGSAMRMLVANYTDGELNLVHMELDGTALSKWMQHPGSHPQEAQLPKNHHPPRETD